jgi:phosphohistidine phosphatase
VPDTTADRTLVLLRHAKAMPDGPTDHDRKLAKRGQTDAAAVGRWFVEADHAFSVVACSPSARTRETWAELAEAGVVGEEVLYDDRIYDASADDLLDVLADIPDEVASVLVVGHAPGIPDLAEFLADPDRSDAESMHTMRRTYPTSCFAVLELDATWSDLTEHCAELTEVAAPRG